MNYTTLIRSCSLILALSLSACGGGGGGGGSDGLDSIPSSGTGNSAPPRAATERLETLTLPGYPHSIDVYGASNATRALVILHGGGGRNYEIAHDLGLISDNDQPSESSIDFARLRADKMLVVSPQGQSVNGEAYTWNNHVMASGEDDLAFLSALAQFIRNKYGVSQVYLMGHSNGGMMVNRFWCESPESFDGYIALSGPASAYYLSHPCTPRVAQPYYGIVGDEDSVLGVYSIWDAETWTIDPQRVASAPEGSVLDPTLIGEWQLHQLHANVGCGATPSLDQAAHAGNVDTWTDCGGALKVQRVFNAGHSIASVEAAAGFSLFDAAVGFIDSLQ